MIRVARRHVPIFTTLTLVAVTYLAGAIAYTNFASVGVARNLLVDNAFLAVAAVGATFVILSGAIDLSVGSVMALTSILIASLIEKHAMHPMMAIAISLAIGGVFGLCQGLIIEVFRLPPFLVTLAGMFFARGAAFVVSPQSIGIKHPFVADVLNEMLTLALPLGERGVSIPVTVDIAIITIAAAAIVLRSSRFGRSVYAVGDDESSALLMGLNIRATRLGVFTLSGLCSALAGVVFTLYQQSGDPAACKGFELDAIAAVVIGGTLLRGGVGSVLGTGLGVLLLGLIQTIITFQGNLSSWWTRIVVGLLVLAFVALQAQLSKREE
ncbi:MAG: sugar ABC transporter permease YjfF [Phycisphaerales bacterium]|jgi:ribose/xylose/arabinose/galactoside ABC-type transport system permease subunit|nr:sugar ABC transporter permease YjfF [Phycisphaerales bacterium]